MVATSIVGPHTIYAATQEWGEVHHGNPRMYLWLKYIGAEEVVSAGGASGSWTFPPDLTCAQPGRRDRQWLGVGAANAAFIEQVFEWPSICPM